MKVLVCNVGSTSLKFKLYEMPEAKLLAVSGVERVGSDHDAIFRYERCSDQRRTDSIRPISRHMKAVSVSSWSIFAPKNTA